MVRGLFTEIRSHVIHRQVRSFTRVSSAPVFVLPSPAKFVRMPRMIVHVRLEPGLEEVAGLMSAPQCRALASVYKRYAHQLEVKAAILDRVHGRRAKPKLPKLGLRRSLLN